MIWLFTLISQPTFAQLDLTPIQKLYQELPDQEVIRSTEKPASKVRRGFDHPQRTVSFDDIIKSGTQIGAIRSGAILRRIETNESLKVTKPIYLNYFRLQDEFGFKYLQNKDGTIVWKVSNDFITPMKDDISLFEAPLSYSPAPDIPKTYYDKGLSLPPEFSFYAGLTKGDFMKDLFEDKSGGSGFSNQYGFHLFTNWKLPIKVGGVGHWEKTTYNLSNGGRVNYSSFSVGPQVKTRDFLLGPFPFRLQLQFRVGPFASASAETSFGSGSFKFNSTDLLASLESPIKNDWGEFVLGFYFQSQWLDLKDQEVLVNLNSSNETNKSFGLSLSQVFE